MKRLRQEAEFLATTAVMIAALIVVLGAEPWRPLTEALASLADLWLGGE